MSVNDLWWELSMQGMDVDGSHETLVARLEQRGLDKEKMDNSGRKRTTINDFERRNGSAQAI